MTGRYWHLPPIHLSNDRDVLTLGRLGVIASNLGNLVRRLALPLAIQSWSLTSLQQRLFKTGARLVRHARYYRLQLAESHLTQRLFEQIIARIGRLVWHPT